MSSVGRENQPMPEAQSQLQGVLVSVKIHDPDKGTNEKRVRFNSLVEVRFIPKVKAKKDKNKEDKEKRKNDEKANNDSSIEGKENVANGNENENRNYTRNDTAKLKSNERRKSKEQTNTKANVENSVENEENLSNTVSREGYFLPKVTIGQEYDLDVIRTAKVTAKPQPRNSIKLLRRSGKETRIHDLNTRSVVHLERQATEHCREADKFFEETVNRERKDADNEENRREESSGESHVTSPQNPPKEKQFLNPTLHRCKSLPEFSRRTSLPETKQFEIHVKGNEISQRKLSTSLPYINMIPTLTGKIPETNKKDSYTKLYLPQLQRKAEEIRRLNETVLRKKPKYSPDRSPTSPSDTTSPLGFIGDKNVDKNSSPPACSHSIVRYSHGLDIARLLNFPNSSQLFY